MSEGLAKKRVLQEKIEKDKIQTKITENLVQLPKNRQILMQREEERERRILIQETKKALWKRWRQRKGRGEKLTTGGDKENLGEKLSKVEAEVKRYKAELEREEREKQEKRDRLGKKRKKEEHWRMMRWILTFIEENKEGLEKRRSEELAARESEEWKLMSKEQKLQKLRKDEKKKRQEGKPGREERLEAAKKLKNMWKTRTNPITVTEEKQMMTGEEEAVLVKEMEMEELMKDGEFLDMPEELCTDCAHSPCLCQILYLELKLVSLKQEKPGARERKRRRSSSSSSERAGVEVHHNAPSPPQHHCYLPTR